MKKRLMFMLLSTMLLAGCALPKITDLDAKMIDEEEVKGSKKDKDKLDADEWMTEQAVNATECLAKMASDEVYVKLYINNSDIEELVADWSEASIDEDQSVVILRADEDTVEDFLKVNGETDGLSDFTKEYLVNQIVLTIPNVLNGSFGTDTLAASSVANYSNSYYVDFDIDNQLWLIPTDEDGLAYGVCFTNAGDDVCCVSARYVVYDSEKGLKKTAKTRSIGFDIEEVEIDY